MKKDEKGKGKLTNKLTSFDHCDNWYDIETC
jgi:hypothetical protein